MARPQLNRPALHSGTGKVWRWIAAAATTMVAAVIVFAKPSSPTKLHTTGGGCPMPGQQVHVRLVRTPRFQAGQLPAHPPDAPGTIHGAKNPELIADNLAYKMMLLSFIIPEKPTDLQKARQQAQMRMLNLSPGDTAALLPLVSDFRDQLKGLSDQVAEIHKVTPAPVRGSDEWFQLADLQQQRDNLVADTTASLATKLSLDGAAKLQARLPIVKGGITHVPLPNLVGY